MYRRSPKKFRDKSTPIEICKSVWQPITVERSLAASSRRYRLGSQALIHPLIPCFFFHFHFLFFFIQHRCGKTYQKLRCDLNFKESRPQSNFFSFRSCWKFVKNKKKTGEKKAVIFEKQRKTLIIDKSL